MNLDRANPFESEILFLCMESYSGFYNKISSFPVNFTTILSFFEFMNQLCPSRNNLPKQLVFSLWPSNKSEPKLVVPSMHHIVFLCSKDSLHARVEKPYDLALAFGLSSFCP